MASSVIPSYDHEFTMVRLPLDFTAAACLYVMPHHHPSTCCLQSLVLVGNPLNSVPTFDRQPPALPITCWAVLSRADNGAHALL